MNRRFVVATFTVALLTTLGVAPPLGAQQQTISDGIETPLPTLVDREDALSLELNPAGLAHLKSWELMYVQTNTFDNLNQGGGAFLATPIVDGLGLGFGAQFLSPELLGEGYRKYTLGLGTGGRLAVGLNYNFMGSDDDPKVDDFSAWDLGFQYRMLPWLGFGALFRDVNAPFLDQTSIEPRTTLGAALRLWRGKILAEPAVTVFSGSKRTQPRFMLAIEPYDGVRVFGHVLTDTGPDGDAFDFVEASTGLQMNLPTLGLTGAGIFDGDGDGGGYSGAVRFSGARWRSFYEGKKRFYRITLSGNPPERAKPDLLGRVRGGSYLGLQRTLQRMLKDPTVKGLVLDFKGVQMGFGQLWELRKTLALFRDKGLPIVAYMHSTNYRDYYVASIADKVFMGPSNTFNARGLSSQRTYYREALDKLGVEPDFLRIAEYKSAPESFLEKGPSPESDEALGAFLDDVWKVQLDQIAADRGIDAKEMGDLIDNAPYTPITASTRKLVDGVFFPDELEEKIKEIYGKKTLISKRYGALKRDYNWGTDPIIAVIYIDGTIVNGNSGSNPLLGGSMIGSETIKKTTEWALKNPNVVGVVVRIDSPGGSAIGSDLMYRALKKLADKKPMIVSMGDIAASGGYYAAAAGRKIYCNPTTLTGSIGIFSGKFGLRGLFNKIGINRVSMKRGEQADLYSLDDAWTPKQREVIQGQIDYLYERFLSIVSEGRSISRDEANKVGRGRIWSGIRAKDNDLCDEHGGLLDAIDHAKAEAGLEADDAIAVIPVPTPKLLSPIGIPGVSATAFNPADFLQGPFIPNLPEDVTAAEIYEAYGPLRALLQPLRPAIDLALTFKDGESLALMPFTLEETD